MQARNDTNLNVEQLILRIIQISIEIKAIEKVLKDMEKMPYDLEKVTTSGENGKEETMGDLHRERVRLQQELQNRLVIHKTKPYVGSDYDGFISKVAAAMLDDSDILEDHLRADFESEIEGMVDRYKVLNVFFVKQKPRKLVLNRLKEALECYVRGYFQGCALLCRATLETALKGKIEEKIGQQPRKSKTLGPLLEDAVKLGIISRDDELADTVKKIGDNTAHEYRRCSPSEALQSLNSTKLLLNILYR